MWVRVNRRKWQTADLCFTLTWVYLTCLLSSTSLLVIKSVKRNLVFLVAATAATLLRQEYESDCNTLSTTAKLWLKVCKGRNGVIRPWSTATNVYLHPWKRSIQIRRTADEFLPYNLTHTNTIGFCSIPCLWGAVSAHCRLNSLCHRPFVLAVCPVWIPNMLSAVTFESSCLVLCVCVCACVCVQDRISLLGGPGLKYVRGSFHYDK